MKKLLLITLITFCFVTNSPSRGCNNSKLFSVTVNGKNGFINQDRKIIVPVVYEELGEFSEGLISFRKDRKWGYINEKGKTIIKPKFDWAASFSEGLARI